MNYETNKSRLFNINSHENQNPTSKIETDSKCFESNEEKINWY